MLEVLSGIEKRAGREEQTIDKMVPRSLKWPVSRVKRC